jgi:hypothetical protein
MRADAGLERLFLVTPELECNFELLFQELCVLRVFAFPPLSSNRWTVFGGVVSVRFFRVCCRGGAGFGLWRGGG